MYMYIYIHTCSEKYMQISIDVYIHIYICMILNMLANLLFACIFIYKHTCACMCI